MEGLPHPPDWLRMQLGRRVPYSGRIESGGALTAAVRAAFSSLRTSGIRKCRCRDAVFGALDSDKTLRDLTAQTGFNRHSANRVVQPAEHLVLNLVLFHRPFQLSKAKQAIEVSNEI